MDINNGDENLSEIIVIKQGATPGVKLKSEEAVIEVHISESETESEGEIPVNNFINGKGINGGSGEGNGNQTKTESVTNGTNGTENHNGLHSTDKNVLGATNNDSLMVASGGKIIPEPTVVQISQEDLVNGFINNKSANGSNGEESCSVFIEPGTEDVSNGAGNNNGANNNDFLMIEDHDSNGFSNPEDNTKIKNGIPEFPHSGDERKNMNGHFVSVTIESNAKDQNGSANGKIRTDAYNKKEHRPLQNLDEIKQVSNGSSNKNIKIPFLSKISHFKYKGNFRTNSENWKKKLQSNHNNEVIPLMADNIDSIKKPIPCISKPSEIKSNGDVTTVKNASSDFNKTANVVRNLGKNTNQRSRLVKQKFEDKLNGGTNGSDIYVKKIQVPVLSSLTGLKDHQNYIVLENVTDKQEKMQEKRNTDEDRKDLKEPSIKTFEIGVEKNVLQNIETTETLLVEPGSSSQSSENLKAEFRTKLDQNRRDHLLIAGERRHSIGSSLEYQKTDGVLTLGYKFMQPLVKTEDGNIWHMWQKQKEVNRLARLSYYSRSRDCILPNFYKSLEKNLPYRRSARLRVVNRPPDTNQKFLYEYRVNLKKLLEFDSDGPVKRLKGPPVMNQKLEGTATGGQKKFKPLAAKICRLCAARCKNFVCIGQNVIIKLIAVNLPLIIIEGDKLRIGLCQTCDDNLKVCSSFLVPYMAEREKGERNLNKLDKCFTCNFSEVEQLKEIDRKTKYKLSLIFEAFPCDALEFFGGKRYLCGKCISNLKLLETMYERICLTNKIFDDVYNGLYDTEMYTVYAYGTYGSLPPAPQNSPVSMRRMLAKTEDSVDISTLTLIDMESYIDQKKTKKELIKERGGISSKSTKKVPRYDEDEEEMQGLFEMLLSPFVDPIRAIGRLVSKMNQCCSRRKVKKRSDEMEMETVNLLHTVEDQKPSPIAQYEPVPSTSGFHAKLLPNFESQGYPVDFAEDTPPSPHVDNLSEHISPFEPLLNSLTSPKIQARLKAYEPMASTSSGVFDYSGQYGRRDKVNSQDTHFWTPEKIQHYLAN